MITRTSELAVKAMILIAREPEGAPLTPSRAAETLGCSPSYLAKILGDLAKAGLVRAHRGSRGGATLARRPEETTLLAIVQACEGVLVPDYCLAIGDALGPVCGFHRAMWDVYMATRDALAKWTLADLAARPLPTGALAGNVECRMAFLAEAIRAGRAGNAAAEDLRSDEDRSAP